MNILYHITNLPPKMAGTEASLQELNILREYFGSELIFINPNLHAPIYLPRLLFGFRLLKQIRAKESYIQAHHIYNADPFPFPVLRRFHRPVIYSISSGVGQRQPNIDFFNQLAAVTVSDERSFERLKTWGLKNIHLVYPGLDTTRFTHTPLPIDSTFKVMVGSAPWTKSQFQSKGINALLQATKQTPNLKLIFLWRGLWLEEMERRVQQLHLESQVEIINKKVDVNQILADVHASIALATNPAIIRAYPHSLIESLAAGKPVLTSRSIPMADYIEQNQCGIIIEAITPDDIIAAITSLMHNYQNLQYTALHMGSHNFSQQTLINSFQKIYQQVVNQ